MRLRALVLVGLVSITVACDHWPGVSKDSPSNPDPTPSASPIGTCSGTPLPCAALSGTDCYMNAGCMDHGTCSGTASISGEACGGELSVQSCTGIPGCFWAPNCIGTPFGKCTGVTESSCLVAKGCVFTPAGDGGAAGTGTCDSYGATCKSNAGCDCGFTCVSKCPTCGSTCGIPCLNEFDCAGTSDGAGTFTPFCSGATLTGATPSPGTCAVTR